MVSIFEYCSESGIKFYLWDYLKFSRVFVLLLLGRQTFSVNFDIYVQGMLISPQPAQEGNKLQRQKILMFIYPIYNHNWRNISTIYIYITRLASNEIFSTSNKIHREVGRAKDLSAPLYIYIYKGADKSLARPGRKQATATEDFDVHISNL